jgi:hypothetical protein
MKKIWLAGCALLVCASAARADVVVDWNIQTQQSIAAGARRGPSGLFDFAIVHAAMHDVVQAFEHRFEMYCGPIAGASGSPIAAAATAAHDVLVGLFPAQQGTLDTALTTSLAKYHVTGDPGTAVGQQAAACVLQRLAADNLKRAQPDTFVGGTGPGEWRPTSPAPMTAQFVATFTPFAIKDPDQFRAANGPPHLTSGAYTKAYNEVKSLGSLTSTARTPDQTKTARFFSDSAVFYWQTALRPLVDAQALNLGDSARLFALGNLSMADAVITAWDSKIASSFWRPITAIREAGGDGNPATVADPTWVPFLTTPNYPDYTSGANNLSGAMTTTLTNFFGSDELEFTITSVTIAAPDNVRHYSRISDAARDVVDARIYEGIHFRFADTVARRQGAHVANWVFGHYLRPLE